MTTARFRKTFEFVGMHPEVRRWGGIRLAKVMYGGINPQGVTSKVKKFVGHIPVEWSPSTRNT